MRKIFYGILATTTLAALPAAAQQLPNVGFEQWKTQCGNSTQVGSTNVDRQRPGVEPEGWNGSSIMQQVVVNVEQELVFKATEDDNNYVQLKSLKVGAMGVTSVAPGFLTFGTPWVFPSMPVSNSDGGVYGGETFAYRPDAIALDVKRVDSNEEVSTVAAYLWAGEFQSKIGHATKPHFLQADVDRAIVGRITPEEGTGKLVASLNHTFASTSGTWQALTIPFEYASDATPEKMNVVICCGDYWNRPNMQENTELLVDNVRFIYSSRLSALKVGGVEVPGFDPDVFEYTIDAAMPATELDPVVTRTGSSNSSSVKQTIDAANRAYVITVSNVAPDADGKSEHVYTVKFTGNAAYTTENYDGYLNVVMLDNYITENQAATLQITPTSETECTLLLPDLSLGDLGTLGDIKVENVKMTPADGKTIYTGEVKDMELLEGAIKADVKINGSITDSKVVDMTISVVWNDTPIDVTFTTAPKGTTEKYDGYLNVVMMDNYITENQAATLEITSTSETECTLLLPNLTLGDLGTLGDIKVENVKMTPADGKTIYTGEVKGMELLDGAIKADVTINGSITDSKVVDMTINVVWNEVPIKVTFTSEKKNSAIEAIDADNNAPAVYYNLNGVRVNSGNLTPGLYIRVVNGRAEKTLVR